MRRYIVLCMLAVAASSLFAQFDPQIGQYMYMPNAYNPAAAGEGDLMKVSGLHRMQFVGITNAPMSTYFTFQSPFEIGKTKHGAGIKFLNDQYGLFVNRSFHLQYAYRHKIGKGYLCAGTDLGFVSVGFKGDSVNLDEMSGSEYHMSDDEYVPTGEQSGMNFDMSLGLYYSTSTWYAGVSYSHVTAPKIHWGDKTTVRLRGTMYVMGGYNFRLKKNKQFVLKPSAMVMTDFTEWDIDLTLLCEYKDRYRWGVMYRIAGAAGLMLGMDIISGLTIGYTCELPTSKLMLESFGSHEIYLAYGFNILKPKRTNRYKSIRYL